MFVNVTILVFEMISINLEFAIMCEKNTGNHLEKKM